MDQLSSKDLHYVKDQLSWELLAMKKCHHYAGECQDQEIQKQLEQVGRMHQAHYEMLLNHLNPSGTAPVQ
ncbi:hypothetical protein [Numidum massiliense]|uniref:hypothetical protein n=1 Tax=Numidum massiliense TaxID=1522315 RepID=UPI0006D551CB|nr:hypothetical protein [Numidum massiliense]